MILRHFSPNTAEFSPCPKVCSGPRVAGADRREAPAPRPAYPGRRLRLRPSHPALGALLWWCWARGLDIAQRICTNGVDLSDKAREAFLVELYREDAITHGQLSSALGLDSYDTDGVLKKHGVFLEIAVEELRIEAAALHDVSPE